MHLDINMEFSSICKNCIWEFMQYVLYNNIQNVQMRQHSTWLIQGSVTYGLQAGSSLKKIQSSAQRSNLAWGISGIELHDAIYHLWSALFCCRACCTTLTAKGSGIYSKNECRHLTGPWRVMGRDFQLTATAWSQVPAMLAKGFWSLEWSIEQWFSTRVLEHSGVPLDLLKATMRCKVTSHW